MTRNRLNDLYFNWLYNKVMLDRTYFTLLEYLHSVTFEYLIPMDSNRADDGTDLRYRFCYEEKYDDAMVATYLDDRPCSVLEMMVALAIREEQIMEDPEVGDRTSLWFMNMLDSLGLYYMTDDYFDRTFVKKAIHDFLHREYGRNGDGGLFTVECDRDLRNEEIWYQMSLYLTHTQKVFEEG